MTNVTGAIRRKANTVLIAKRSDPDILACANCDRLARSFADTVWYRMHGLACIAHK